MACDLIQTELAGCLSEIKKIESQTRLLRLIAELSCEIAAAGGGGGGTPSLPLNSVQFNEAGAFGGSANFTWDDSLSTLTVAGEINTGTLEATVDVLTSIVNSVGGALQFMSNNINRANFSAAGNLLFNTDNTLDIGAAGATRPRRGYFGTELLAPLVSIAAAANANALAVTGYSLTGANAQSMLDLAGTWNTTGNPAGIRLAITNTASGATAMLINLLAGAGGATSMFSVDKDGRGVLANRLTTPIIVSAGTLTLAATSSMSFDAGGSTRWSITATGALTSVVDNGVDIGAVGATRPRNIYLAGGLAVEATVTAAGTTGNQTIDKFAGTVNFAAAATAITVTCNKCTTSSLVFAVVRTNDGTAALKNVVPGAGSFVINLSAAATAETSVGFYIVNPD